MFLHARECDRYPETATVPASFLEPPRMMLRGYSADERIADGTWTTVETRRLVEAATAILDDPADPFVDLRSASNGCFQARVERQDRVVSRETVQVPRSHRLRIKLGKVAADSAGTRPRSASG